MKTVQTLRHTLFATLLGLSSLPVLAASHSSTTFIAEQDLNGDGKVLLSEFKLGRQVEFMRIDFDADGVLSEAEYLGEFEGRLMLRIGKIADPEKRREELQRQMRQAKVRFGVLDTDKDGRITLEEFQAAGLRMFKLHDRNQDGVVDDTDVKMAEEDSKAGKTGFVSP
ncbi:EF hand [Roseateles sp. YR242]|uniref:EF-hand domain-containing protein n=1 Tax=Roseateles sp. YR242 TaxID=1855305 RepID=UPI0008D12F32|nr:EF-hand domain-containing protein [Roseateles sp. YR242]SEK20551.1 EF hand [Roseateles sp. YR242]